MKKIICAALLLTSLSTMARERSFLITEPKYPGSNLAMTIETWDAEHGVCRLLGFEKAVSKSSAFSSVEERTLVINANGAILKADSKARITEIICINKTSEPTVPEIVLEIEPKHLDSNLSVSIESWDHEIGVCRMLGHSGVVPRSSVFGESEKVLMLNADGLITHAKVTSKIKNIICLH